MIKIDVEDKAKNDKDDNDTPFVQAFVRPQKKSSLRRLRHLLRTRRRKVFVSIILVLLIGLILAAIPVTRYGILGHFIKKDVSIIVKDKATHKPVSQATIRIGDKSVTTTSNGEAKVGAVPIGEYNVKVSKKYYKDDTQPYTVPITGEVRTLELQLAATGRQALLSVVNKVTNLPLAKALVTVGDTSTATDEKGLATIVLPADKTKIRATIVLDKYNKADVEVNVTDQAGANNFSVTPSGSLYYLNKGTGKINVMKSNLDGTDAKTVLAGTGNENDRETALLAARDWQYLALSAKRTTNKGDELYLIDTKTDQLKTIDEGDASFDLVGWANHKFIYIVNRTTTNYWDQNKQTMKSYDADTGKITVLDNQVSIGTSSYDYEVEYFGKAYIQDNRIIYSKSWSRSNTNTSTDKKAAIMGVNADATGKNILREFAIKQYVGIDAKLYEPREIYFKVNIDGGASVFYEFEDSALKPASSTDDKFYNSVYPTYLLSPGDEKTFWSDPRNGKNTLFVGDRDANNEKTIASESEYTAYGWYGDGYVLLSKNGNELYIASSSSPLGEKPLKITNYHKPVREFVGYGSGYGGI